MVRPFLSSPLPWERSTRMVGRRPCEPGGMGRGSGLTPGPVPALFIVPMLGGLPYPRDTGLQMLADNFVDDVVYAEARLVLHGDEAVLDQRPGQAGDDVVPPVYFDAVIFERHEVFRGHRDMRGSHRRD